jgi:hypothetical protein
MADGYPVNQVERYQQCDFCLGFPGGGRCNPYPIPYMEQSGAGITGS